MSRIVVGVDGSTESERALRWAAEEARLRDATLQVVLAYHAIAEQHLYTAVGAELGAGPQAGVSARTAANKQLDAIVARVGDVTAGLAVEREAVEGGPAGVLVDRSKDADLLVVGSRGRGGFSGLLLGSVSQQCTQHARCPVVVIPAE